MARIVQHDDLKQRGEDFKIPWLMMPPVRFGSAGRVGAPRSLGSPGATPSGRHLPGRDCDTP